MSENQQTMPKFVNLNANKDKRNGPLSDSGYSKVNHLKAYDYNDNGVINEVYLNSDYSESSTINKLAYLDTVNETKVVRKDLFSEAKSYKDMSLYSNGETNEGIKLKMEKEFLQGNNPRLYVSKAISSILENVEKEFVLDDKTRNAFLNAEDEEQRRELIFQLNKKQDSANLKLAEAFSTCDDLFQTLKRAEDHIKKANSFKTTSENIMDSEIDGVFTKHLQSTSITTEAKQDIFNAVKAFDFSNSQNLTELELAEHRENLKQNVSNILTPFLAKENIKMTDGEVDIDEEAQRIINDLSEVKKVNDDINKYTSFVSELNSKVKMTNNFTTLYKDFNDCYEMNSKLKNIDIELEKLETKDKTELNNLKEKYGLDDVHRIKNKLELDKELLLRNGNAKLSIIKNIFELDKTNIMDSIKDKKAKQSIESFMASPSLDFSETISEWHSNKVASHYLNNIVTGNIEKAFLASEDEYSFSKNEKQDITKIVYGNIERMTKQYSNALKKEDGTFDANMANQIYNDFHKNNYQSIMKSVLTKTDDNDSAIVKRLKEDLKDLPEPNFVLHVDKVLRDDIVDVMNFNALSGNSKIKSTIGDNEEIEKIANQTINNMGLKNFANEIHHNYMKEENKRIGEIKKDITIDEHIRNVATKKYDNLANSLLNDKLNRTIFSKKLFDDFSSCVGGTNIKKTGADTKLSGLSSCVDKYIQELEGEGKENLAGANQRLNGGTGALNPFDWLSQYVALYKKIQARYMKRHIGRITDEINRTAIEIGSATNDLERRSRAFIMHSEDNAGIYMSAVHDTEKHMLATEFKQEYLAKSVIEAIDIENLTNLKGGYDDFINNTNSIMAQDLSFSSIIDNKLSGLNDEDFKEAIEASSDRLSKEGIDTKTISNLEDLKNKGASSELLATIANNSQKITFEDIPLGNLKFKDKEKKIIYNSDITTEQIRRLDAIQQKLIEFELDYHIDIREVFNNVKNSSEEEYLVLGDNSSLNSKAINTHLLKTWLNDNEIGYAEFEKAIAKGFEQLEQDKNKLIIKAIVENLEEQRDFLRHQESSLVSKKNEFAKLHDEFKHYDSHNEASANPNYEKYKQLQAEINKIEKSFSEHIRPEARITKTINEVKSIFASKNRKTQLEHRNTLSNALNILNRSGHSVENLNAITDYLSADTDFTKDKSGNDKTIVGFAIGRKGYDLKINKMAKESQIRYDNNTLKRHFETLDYESDKRLLNGTDEERAITSLSSWSNTMTSATDVLSNNSRVAESNKDLDGVRETLYKSNNGYFKEPKEKIDSNETLYDEAKGLDY